MTRVPAQVSVIIPTCARPELLERCLAALLRQSLPASSFEILVVDDAASSDTLASVARWTEASVPDGPRIQYLSV